MSRSGFFALPQEALLYTRAVKIPAHGNGRRGTTGFSDGQAVRQDKVRADVVKLVDTLS